MTPSEDLPGFQGSPRLGVEQGQQMTGLHEILQLGLLIAGQGTLLVLLSQLAHPVLVFLIKAKCQNVPGQFARQVGLIRLDESPWYRMECGLGRFSVVGTTVRTATLPEHLLADEHHQVLDGQKVYIATTVGNGCCLGAEPAEAAGSDKLKVAYQVFKDEACDVSPKYAPKTVSTDGWKGTQAAWKLLFTKVVILLCFLHGWLKIRDRAKHLKEVFAEVSRRVWDTYHAPDRRSFAQRLRSLRQWAAGHLTGKSRSRWSRLVSVPVQMPYAFSPAEALSPLSIFPVILHPDAAVERPISHRLGNVLGLDLLGAFQVGDGPGDAEDLVVSPRG